MQWQNEEGEKDDCTLKMEHYTFMTGNSKKSMENTQCAPYMPGAFLSSCFGNVIMGLAKREA